GTNQYPGAVFPQGYRHLHAFRLDPFPTWSFNAGGAVLEKQIFLVHGEQTVVVRYRATRRCALRVAPFLAFRDFHALGRANGSFDASVEELDHTGSRRLAMHPYPGLPPLFLHASGGTFDPRGAWHHATEYLEELERGLDFREDLYRIGTLSLQLGPERDA